MRNIEYFPIIRHHVHPARQFRDRVTNLFLSRYRRYFSWMQSRFIEAVFTLASLFVANIELACVVNRLFHRRSFISPSTANIGSAIHSLYTWSRDALPLRTEKFEWTGTKLQNIACSIDQYPSDGELRYASNGFSSYSFPLVAKRNESPRK